MTTILLMIAVIWSEVFGFSGNLCSKGKLKLSKTNKTTILSVYQVYKGLSSKRWEKSYIFKQYLTSSNNNYNKIGNMLLKYITIKITPSVISNKNQHHRRTLAADYILSNCHLAATSLTTVV